MSYLHIENLYKSQDILLFKEAFALEKIHGTSAHISWKDGQLTFFSGGEKHDKFISLFNVEELKTKIEAVGPEAVIFGEAYGGKCQGMSGTYGKELKFIAFEVKIGESWLSVPQAEEVARVVGMEFVHYTKIPVDLAAIDAERDADSVQAVRNGIGSGKMREGIVLRPLIEVRKNNGERVICKHKRAEFGERKTEQLIVNPDKLAVLTEATAVADEWVTPMRLKHVLDKFPGAGIDKTGEIIKAMVEDVEREAAGEVIFSKEVRQAVSKRTAQLFKESLKP